MTLTLVIGGLTVVSIIASLLLKFHINIKGRHISVYWIIALIGAILLLLTNRIDLSKVWAGLTSAGSINPLKLLVIFFSMTALSVFLDELGFFEYLASLAIKRAKSNQMVLFRYLFIVVSLLTVFTSNDVVILTFTPFILHFAKNANVNPMPYLISEFVAANTLSMTLIIGNPTNIYLASSYGVDFFSYFKIMVIPSVFSAFVAYFVLKLIFHNDLHKPIMVHMRKVEIENTFLLKTGIIHLVMCIIVLTISQYVGFEMWYVCLGFVASLFIITVVYCIVKNKKPYLLGHSLHRLPYELAPFMISMFVLALALHECGFTYTVAQLLGENSTVWIYGPISFLSANVFNNIPMSVLFADVMSSLTGEALTGALYSSVIGSNIGAYLTPIGALAGIMWLGILKKNGYPLSFVKFMKYGLAVSLPIMATALLGLGISISLFV